jgi:hypothetical protein
MECELPNVGYYMKGGKLCNDVDILDIIWNVYVFEVKGCCVNC